MTDAGRAIVLLALLSLAGCAAPTNEDLPMPMGSPESWYPAPGVEWGNMTGEIISPGFCNTSELRVAPPTRVAWWFAAEPNATILVKDWVAHGWDGRLCATNDPDEARSARNTTRHHWVEDVRAGEGIMLAFACDAEVPCEVSMATQRIREADGPDGSRVWAGEVGPAPSWYGT